MANAEKLENVVRKINTEFEDDKDRTYPYEAEDNQDEVEDVDVDNEEELEDEQDEQEDAQPARTAKKPSKEQQKIIALKRENQRLAEENRKLAVIQAQEVKASTDRKADLKKQYIADGYEEDVASNMADRDERLHLQDQRLSAIEFREENYDVLSKYPQSRKDINTIMNAVRSTPMTIEQVCAGLYGGEMSYNDRARAAAEGTLPRRNQDDYVSAVGTNGSRRRQQTLTAYDKEQKAKLEDLTGIKITNERYLEHKSKYDL